jgi:hypothetical protein
VAIVAIHPSFLLHIKNAADKKRRFRNFVRDLRISNALSGAAVRLARMPVATRRAAFTFPWSRTIF